MKKKYFLTGFILLLSCSLVFIGVSKSNRIKEDIALRNIIIETVKKSNEIDFARVTSFQWDKMYVIPPYSIPNDILWNFHETTEELIYLIILNFLKKKVNLIYQKKKVLLLLRETKVSHIFLIL